jgi:hypothetical protein
MPKKEPLTHLDVWDESGTRLTVLNTRENGALAARALALLAAETGEVLSPEQRQQLTAIAGENVELAKATLADALPWLDKALPEGTSGRALCEDLSEAFMLLVPIVYEPGRPRLVKWSIDEPIAWYGHNPQDETRLIRWATALSLLDKVHSFPNIAIGLSESFHVEVVAPKDVEISDAIMIATRWRPAGADQPGRITSEVASVARQHERAHLNVGVLADHGDTEKARGDTGTVVLTLRARRTGSFQGLWITALLIAVMLLVIRLRMGELDSTNAVALLLVFPALVAAYLARPGEHILAGRLLVGVRFVGLMASVCALAGAGMIASGLLQSRAFGAAPPTTHCSIAATTRRERGPRRWPHHRMPEGYRQGEPHDPMAKGLRHSGAHDHVVEQGGKRGSLGGTLVCTNATSHAKARGPTDIALATLDVLIGLAVACAAILAFSFRAVRALDKRLNERRMELAAPILAHRRGALRADTD